MRPIYLDHHATTPLDPRVLEEMMPYLTEKFGNASSMDHAYGYDASVAVEDAREKIAKAIGARPSEIIFTSGATESNNLAIKGVMDEDYRDGVGFHTCKTEHKSVLDLKEYLVQTRRVFHVSYVNEYGEPYLATSEGSLDQYTRMVSIMTANNEIGTIVDVKKLGHITHEYNAVFHTDAAQAVGHIPMNVNDMNIDLMSISSHKMCGPKGVGALYVRGRNPRVKLEPILQGGGQERNLRSGTLNVPGIVGFGKAIEIAQKEMADEDKRYREWSRAMLESFEDAGAELNGHPTNRLSHNLNVYFPGVESKALVNTISKEVAISAGSACTADSVEPSHVLLALGFSEERAHSSIRIGMGRGNTEDEINHATERILDEVKHLRLVRI